MTHEYVKDVPVWIPIASLEHRRLYRVRARCFEIAVWDSAAEWFVGIREKFDKLFLAEESHWDAPVFASCKPIEALSDILPTSIGLQALATNPALFEWLTQKEAEYGAGRP